MAPKSQTYNANDRASELAPTSVVVGAETYTVKRSGKALRQIIEMAPDEGEDKQPNPSENIGLLYASLAILLVNEKGDHPDSEQLEEDLDFEVAQELMEKFVPVRGAEGEVSTPPQLTAVSDEASSTTT